MTESLPAAPFVMDIEKIAALLPHRYPFLLIDRVLELDVGVRVKALKNVTANEPFFNGHFPNKKVMPGVLMIEALAQAAAILEESQDRTLHSEETGRESSQTPEGGRTR